VPDDLLLQCIELAEQAPSGGDISSRRWLVVRDPEIKKQLADLYRFAGGSDIIERAEQRAGTDHPKQRVVESAAHLAANLERVPALVLVTVWGEHDGSGRPGLFDSVIQSAWSFCLALRARGLGSAWTTVHLGKAQEFAEVLGIPTGVTQVVLLPVAWTVGTDFKPASRRPASEIVWFDRWGFTKEQIGDAEDLIAAGPGVTVEIDIAASRLPRRLSGSWSATSTFPQGSAPSSREPTGSTQTAHGKALRSSAGMNGLTWTENGRPRPGSSLVKRLRFLPGT